MNKLKNKQRLRKLKKIASRYSGGWWMEFSDNGNGERHSTRYTRCYLCSRTGILDQMTIDHHIPRYKWRWYRIPRWNSLPNLGLAHCRCNHQKAKSENPLYKVKQKKPLWKRLRKICRCLRYHIQRWLIKKQREHENIFFPDSQAEKK